MNDTDKKLCMKRISVLAKHREEIAKEIDIPYHKETEQEYSELRKSYSALEKAFLDTAEKEAELLLKGDKYGNCNESRIEKI